MMVRVTLTGTSPCTLQNNRAVAPCFSETECALKLCLDEENRFRLRSTEDLLRYLEQFRALSANTVCIPSSCNAFSAQAPNFKTPSNSHRLGGLGAHRTSHTASGRRHEIIKRQSKQFYVQTGQRVLRVGRGGRSQLLQVGYKKKHLEKGIPPIVGNKETCHSRIKSLGGLPKMKETRAGKRNKRKKFCKDSTISHESPMFKG